MKFLCLYLIVVLIFSGCNILNNTNPYLAETQNAQISNDSSTFTPQATNNIFVNETQISNTTTVTPIVEMSVYQDKELGIQISYPGSWAKKSERMFVGIDGYLIINKLDTYHSPNLGHVAVDFANTYYPQFAVYCIGNGGVGCTLDERKFVDSEKFVGIIPYKWNFERADYFSIETTRQYYMQIVHSIILPENAFEPTPTAYPGPSLNPKEINLDGISLVEMPLSEYQDKLMNSPLIVIGGNNCGATNKKDMYQLMTDPYGRMQILMDKKIIYNYSSWGFADNPPWTFCQWGESWTLETQEIVIINGVNLNHETGYDEIFGWHLLREKPTFFVKTGNKYYVSIDKKLLPVEYEEISHYGCCEAGYATNPKTNGINTWFHAKRSGVWYAVVITVQ